MIKDVLTVKRSDPIYNAHSYLTKVPVGAIIPFIQEYTDEGDLVVDMFAGSGMTAVAAKMTNRNAVVSDISVLGQHIGTGYLSSIEPHNLVAIAKNLVSESKEACGKNYHTIREEDGAKVEFGKTKSSTRDTNPQWIPPSPTKSIQQRPKVKDQESIQQRPKVKDRERANYQEHSTKSFR